MAKKYFAAALGLCLGLLLSALPLAALSETPVWVFLLPEKDPFLDPEILKINLVVDPGLTRVNAVLGALEFDPQLLEITSFRPHDSFCALSPFSYADNDNGLFVLACGRPEAAASAFNLAEISFTKKKPGRAAFLVSDFVEICSPDNPSLSLPVQRELHYIDIVMP